MQRTVCNVERRSPAWRAGLRAGMKIDALNGEPLRDFVDFQYAEAQAEVELQVTDGKKQRTLVMRKQPMEPMGFEVEEEMYPKERHCANRCIFCFVDQTPEGLRETLYDKDDDWRYSVMFGNYVTLTNVSATEMDRIIAREMSPLFVSVHATDPEVRVRMLRNPKAGDIMDRLRRLTEGGIECHCQVVLCPGINDGAVLDRTLMDLLMLYPGVRSVAVVPLGLTRFRDGLEPLTPLDAASAAAVIRQVEKFSQGCVNYCGERFCYCSDEMYQLAGLPWPVYHGLDVPQESNGVGLFDDFLSGAAQAMEDIAPEDVAPGRRVTLATGMAAHDTLQQLCEQLMARYPGLEASCVAIRNDFWGDQITVAGLIVGQDMAAQLKGRPLGEALLIPECSLRAGESVFLDGTDMAWLEAQLGVPVWPVPSDGYSFVCAVLGLDEMEEC